MSGVKDKVWFLREGLFAKYVIALVGLVVFVLAVNGAMEIWISYRGIKTSLTDAMSEKAEATAKRIEQSMSDLERQISWATRAYSYTPELRRADYTQLLRQVPQVSQLTLLSAHGREQLRVNRQTVTEGSNVDYARDLRFTETRRPRHQLCGALFPRRAAVDVDLAVAFGSARSPSPRSTFASSQDFLGDTEVGKVALCLYRRRQGPGAGEFGQGARRRQGSLRACRRSPPC